MSKSYQEQILERVKSPLESMKDCWAIARLEQEELSHARTAAHNQSSRENMKKVQDEIAAILAKYGLKP